MRRSSRRGHDLLIVQLQIVTRAFSDVPFLAFLALPACLHVAHRLLLFHDIAAGCYTLENVQPMYSFFFPPLNTGILVISHVGKV